MSRLVDVLLAEAKPLLAMLPLSEADSPSLYGEHGDHSDHSDQGSWGDGWGDSTSWDDDWADAT